MMGYVIAFAGGLVVGTFCGLLTVAICVAASDADRHIERWEDENERNH